MCEGRGAASAEHVLGKAMGCVRLLSLDGNVWAAVNEKGALLMIGNPLTLHMNESLDPFASALMIQFKQCNGEGCAWCGFCRLFCLIDGCFGGAGRAALRAVLNRSARCIAKPCVFEKGGLRLRRREVQRKGWRHCQASEWVPDHPARCQSSAEWLPSM